MGKFRLLHTSDWHLGQVLYEQSRQYEQKLFLDWLLTVLEDEQIDALVLAGDVFDSPNPTARSQQLLYSFLAAAKARLPALDVVIIAGEQDSAARLDAIHPVLAAFGVHLVGGLLPTEDGTPDLGRCLITLYGANGSPAAYLAAVPYGRARDLSLAPGTEDADQKRAQAMGSICRLACQEVVRRAGSELPSVVAGHLRLIGSRDSEASGRKLRNGDLAALPPELFCPEVSYVALGHVHLAQAVSDNIYYSGSPLPLSFPESDYCHQVLVAGFDGPRLVEVRPVAVPCPVSMLRITSDGPQRPEQVLHEIRQLEGLEGRDPSSPARPYLEVRVLLEESRPALQEEISRELQNKWPRLLAISLHHGRSTKMSHRAPPKRGLDELSPEQVFRHCYRRKYSSATSILNEPSEQLMHAFRLLCEEQEKGEAG